jgi:hypothetical protein
MCDYSLEKIASRPARLGDQLRVQSFLNTSTRGFSDIHDPNTAVCLRPGTELAFEADVRYDKILWFWARRSPSCLARFRQINPENAYKHHDALELADGTVILLTRLVLGQQALVLQLPREQSPIHQDLSASTGQKVEAGTPL